MVGLEVVDEVGAVVPVMLVVVVPLGAVVLAGGTVVVVDVGHEPPPLSAHNCVLPNGDKAPRLPATR